MNLTRRGFWSKRKRAAQSGVDIGSDSLLTKTDLETFGIANGNSVKIDSASVANGEFARFTTSGLESRSAEEVLSDIGAEPAKGEDDNFVTDEEKAQIGDGKVKTASGDSSEFLASKIRAGAGIDLTVDSPAEVDMTDEEYATYGALVIGESVSSGDRIYLKNATNDTANDYFAGVKGSAIIANDVFEDVDATSAIYLGNLSDGDFKRISIAVAT